MKFEVRKNTDYKSEMHCIDCDKLSVMYKLVYIRDKYYNQKKDYPEYDNISSMLCLECIQKLSKQLQTELIKIKLL